MVSLSDSAAHHGHDEPIAVIGLSCRFPGEAETPKGFWDMLKNGKQSATEPPANRWHNDGYHQGQKGRRNAVITPRAHFLAGDIAAFDAEFFHMNQAEVLAMDPQQRIMLEVTYETFENAGLSMEGVAGSSTAVYVGAFTSDWREMQFRDLDSAPVWAVTGSGVELLANRTSWFYDLRGPSMTVNTACSASMAGLHLACQSLRNGEASMALVGGVNLLLSPEVFALLSNQNFLAPDGICKSFDARGNGYSRGEGVAALLLKPVSQAVRDGDTIRAVIRATGSNQDGKTPTITMPSTAAQAELIRATYKSAGLDPKDTHYCEAHGTGTAAGDPAELSALAETLCNGRRADMPLYVGSVKTNIGHLESAAGLAGVIKAVLSLESGIIPASLNLKQTNPKLHLQEWNMRIPTTATPWPYSGPRRVSVNSFGYGGTNAHVILEDANDLVLQQAVLFARTANGVNVTNGILSTNGAYGVNGIHTINGTNGVNGTNGTNGAHHHDTVSHLSTEPATTSGHARSKFLLPLSTHDQKGLNRLCDSLAKHFEGWRSDQKNTGKDQEAQILQDLSYTLGSRRSRLPWKSFMVVSSVSELQDVLTAGGTESEGSRNSVSSRVSVQAPRIGFVFTGQGAQWAQMGMELYHDSAIFRNSVQAASIFLETELKCPWSPIQELFQEEGKSRIHEALYSQALCTIVQVAIVDVLEAWNITPVSVVGHSSGEIAAAYCLGALTREDAWRVAYYRGFLCSQQQQLQQGQKPTGSMMAVGASSAKTNTFIERAAAASKGDGSSGKCTIACVNSPSSVTVSGDATAVEQVRQLLQAEGVTARILKVSAAYHSHHMAPLARPYMEALTGLETLEGTPGRRMFSSVTGQLVDPEELGAMNWVRNLVSPVLFSDAVASLLDDKEGGVDFLIEVGPHPALRGPVKHQAAEIDYLATLSRNSATDALTGLLNLAGEAYIRGVPVNFTQINGREGRHLSSLPPYAWNHTRTFWSESRIARANRLRRHPRGSLLGAPYAPLTPEGRLWRGFIRPSEEPWISHHKIQASIVYPAAGFLAMAIEAARQMIADEEGGTEESVSRYVLRDVKISTALMLTENSDVECILEVKPAITGDTSAGINGWLRFMIASSTEGAKLQEHCSGLLMIEAKPAPESAAAAELALETAADAQAYKHAVAKSTDKSLLMGADELYDRLDALGLNYGSSFRNLVGQVLSTDTGNGTTGICCCTLRLPENISSPSITSPAVGARPHIIHPVVLDAMLHAAFAAAMSDSSADEAAVPSSIREVIIQADTPYEGGVKMAGHALTRKHGYNAMLSDLDFLDDAGSRSLVKISGLKCIKVGGPSAGVVRTGSASKPICSNLKWTPILSLAPELTLASNPITPFSEEMESPTTGLVRLIDTYALWKPTARIMLVDLGSRYLSAENLLQELLSGPSQQRSLATVRFTFASTEQSSSTERIDDELSLCDFVSLKLTEDVLLQGVEAGSFDAVLLCGNLFDNLADRVDQGLSQIHKLLKSGGNVYMVVSRPSIEQQMTVALDQHGFLQDFTCPIPLATEDEAVDSPQLTLYAATKSGHRHESTVRDITILQPSSPSTRVQTLIECLTENLKHMSIAVKTATWPADADPSQPPALEYGGHFVSLLEVDDEYMVNLDERNFDRLQKLILNASEIIWVSGAERPEHELMTGLARTIKNEIASVSLRLLHLAEPVMDVHRHDSVSAPLAASAITRILFASHTEDEFLLRNGSLHVSRIVEDKIMNRKIEEMRSGCSAGTRTLGAHRVPLKLCIGTPGLLDSLVFEADDMVKIPLADDELELDVKATGVNFRDIMVCMGQIPDNLLGFEASGIVSRIGSKVTEFRVGDFICAIGHGAHRTTFRTKALFCQQMPTHMDFAEAAGLPLVHCTAYHALVNVARLQKGQSVLIHAAAGGVGQAAVQLAQHMGLRVFATVGSPAKRELLQTAYGVLDDHIFYSRDTSFAKGVMRMTDGLGVDCVLNSLAGESLRQSWSCIGPFGTFVEIGIKDILANSALEMRPFLQDATFAFLNLEHVQRRRPALMGALMSDSFALLRDGVTRPVQPQNTYAVSRVEEAFRLMQSGRHTGKICISLAPEDVIPVRLNPAASIDLAERGAYLLIGGLGGLGRSLARLLVHHGARHICFISRSATATLSEPAKALLKELRTSSVQVEHFECDISDEAALRQTVCKIESDVAPLAGVIQCAMVLRDGLFAGMHYKDWTDSLAPKVRGTSNIVKALYPQGGHARNLDFFLLLSSFSGIFGNMGQSNYAAGCTYQDGVAHALHALGHKAVAIDLGIMRDVGVLAEQGAKSHHLREWEEPFGIRENEFHALIKTVIAATTRQGGHSAPSTDIATDDEMYLPTQIVTGLATGGEVVKARIPEPFYLSTAKFSPLRSAGVEQGGDGSMDGKKNKKSIAAELTGATSLTEAALLVQTAVVAKIAAILNTTVETIDTNKPLHTYGVDSLVALEVSNWALNEMQVTVSTLDLLKAMPIAHLSEEMAQRSQLVALELKPQQQ